MISADPLPPTTLRPRKVQASVLAAFQLVEDAHYLGIPPPPRGARGSWPSAPWPTVGSPGTCAPAERCPGTAPGPDQATQNSLPSGSAIVTQ